MPVAVPALNQFYPTVPLKELTSFYSAGGHAFAPTGNPPQTHRVAVLSYLPKTLMIYDNFDYNNKYILFAEAMTQVASVTWSVKLYLNGVEKPEGTFIRTDASNPFEFNIYFQESIIAGGVPAYDRMVVTCKVVSGQTKTIEMEHNFAQATNVTGLVTATSSVAFAGEPHTYNFMANQLKEYFPNEKLKWNDQEIESNAAYNEALIYVVLGVLYHNILKAPSMNAKLDKSFDWQNFTRADLVKAINNNTAYGWDFRVGLGMIPLYVLNDAMVNIEDVPDFTNILFTNPIYQVLSSTPPLTYNSRDPLPPDTPYVQQSKARLMGDRKRLIALFQYAMFPKSAIKLISILVKFLWEASRRNSCNECKNRTTDFPGINLGNHKQTPDLLRNILTHYFRDPYNKIDEFAPEALRVTDLTMSPYTYSLMNNVAPRILKAYFAKRVVKKISDEYFEFNFERTDSMQFRSAAGAWLNENNTPRMDPTTSPLAGMQKPAWDNFLGRETFLVVETWNCKGKTVRCNIGVPANTFNVGVSNNNLQVYMDGNALYDIDRNFKDYSALNTNQNSLPGTDADMVKEHLDLNHGNKFIARIKLRPDTLANFNAWTDSLANNRVNLTIKAKLTDNTACFFGNNIQQTATTATFLDGSDPYNNQARYAVLNRVVFESHHAQDIFSRLGAGRLIGRVPNHFVQNIANDNAVMLPFRKFVYFYMDELGHEHFLCDIDLLKPFKRRDGIRVYKRSDLGATDAIIDNFLANYPAHGNRFYYQRIPNQANQLVSIDTTPPTIRQPQNDMQVNLATSRWKYYASHDNVTTFPAGRWDEYDQIVVRGVHDNALVSFQKDDRDVNQLRVEIVKMPDQLHYAFKTGTTSKLIHFTFFLTWRRYAHPGCFAAFIGVLAQLNYNDMLSTGMCFDDATSYPSVSHPNGDSIDTVHRTPLAEKQQTVTAFRTWGFTQIISGDEAQYLNDGADLHQADHNNHLHSGNFNVNSVIDLVQ